MSRPSRDEFWFGLAAAYATMATCPRASIGCVIVNPRTHRQVGAGYNGAPAGEAHCTDVSCLMLADHCIRATHAEINAAGQVTPGLRDLVVYVVGGRDVCSHCARELYAVGVRDVRSRESVLSLDGVLAESIAWAAETFVHQSATSKLEHLRREALELAEHPADASEWADVLILMAGAADLRGLDLAVIVARKLAILRTRTWGEPDADGVVEHVREAAS